MDVKGCPVEASPILSNASAAQRLNSHPHFMAELAPHWSSRGSLTDAKIIKICFDRHPSKCLGQHIEKLQEKGTILMPSKWLNCVGSRKTLFHCFQSYSRTDSQMLLLGTAFGLQDYQKTRFRRVPQTLKEKVLQKSTRKLKKGANLVALGRSKSTSLSSWAT